MPNDGFGHGAITHEGRTVAAIDVGSRRYSALPSHTRRALEGIAAQMGGAIAVLRTEALLRQVKRPRGQ